MGMIEESNRANPAKKIVISDQSSAEIRTQFLRRNRPTPVTIRKTAQAMKMKSMARLMTRMPGGI
jgi:hypothetical protein